MLGNSYTRGRLIHHLGDGAIDPDEDDTLITEIQRLIRINGEDAPAEEFLP